MCVACYTKVVVHWGPCSCVTMGYSHSEAPIPPGAIIIVTRGMLGVPPYGLHGPHPGMMESTLEDHN